MISIEMPGIGQHRVRQTLYAPAVYFDHWALRRFSERRELADRLVAALHAKQATLLVSTQNFAEFAAIEDPHHARDAEAFLDRCLPHLYFADFATDPGFMLVHGKPADTVDAPDDNWLAIALVALWHANGEKLTTADLFITDEAHRAVLLDAFQDMKSSVAAMVQAIKKDDGVLKATVLYPPTMAASAIDLARALGQTKGVSGLAEFEIPASLTLYSAVVDKDNVDQYMSTGFK